MKRLIILVFCLVLCWGAQAQIRFSAESPFFNDEFKVGFVHFLDGETGSAELNYNLVTQEMQFLDHQNNNAVLTLVRDPNISHITIGTDTFVPVGRQGFAVVIQNGPVTLLRKKHLVREERQKGAFGTPTTTAAVDVVTQFDFNSMVGLSSAPTQLAARPIDYLAITEYFLMRDRGAVLATRRNFLRLYRDVRSQLERFMNENNIDFQNEQHLRGLTMFANSLLMAKR
ncbi:MAG: hypothetical protein FWC94_07910 [Bacteroidales bacterium]|nr:hypothetical protein [Bacteroidales bacterium]